MLADAEPVTELLTRLDPDSTGPRVQHEAYLADLREGRPVLIQHGWEIGHPDPNSGPFLLGADDRLGLMGGTE